MLNQKPTANSKYNQGLFIPTNKNKIMKFNLEGGLYYRSGLELKAMKFLDLNPTVTLWGTEFITIPYVEVKKFRNGETEVSKHRYFPDFYYEMMGSNGLIKKVIMEIKPDAQTVPPKPPNKTTTKALNSYDYALNEYNKNMHKWAGALEYCKKKGFEFIIVTETIIDKYLKGKLQ
jgi:hypothetical protein